MNVNPKTASRKWGRITNKKQEQSQSNGIGRYHFDSWSTSRNGFFKGRRVMHSFSKYITRVDEYMNRITKRDVVKLVGGGEREVISYVDHVQNTNRYTNGARHLPE